MSVASRYGHQVVVCKQPPAELVAIAAPLLTRGASSLRHSVALRLTHVGCASDLSKQKEEEETEKEAVAKMPFKSGGT